MGSKEELLQEQVQNLQRLNDNQRKIIETMMKSNDALRKLLGIDRSVNEFYLLKTTGEK